MKWQDSGYLIITIVGSHAGEELKNIFLRKQKDIEKTKKTYWLLKSFKAKTDHIQEFCNLAKKDNQECYCLFIEAGSKNGAKPTINNQLAKEISKDGLLWQKAEHTITGKVDKQSTALVMSKLTILDKPELFDFWNYSEPNKVPIKLQLGASTGCCIKRKSKGMVSRYRNIVAIGKLINPYAVWVR